MADDTGALEIISERNRFYQINYRRVLKALVFSFIVMILLIILDATLLAYEKKPLYFATTHGWQIQKLYPLDSPVLSDQQLLQWSEKAVISIYNFNFVNYRKQLQDASIYFTNNGYTDFMQALKGSNNLETVKEKKLLVSAVVTDQPVIIAQGLIGTTYAWRVQMPILITWQSASYHQPQRELITLVIERQSTLEKPEGVAINQFIGAPLSSTPFS